MNVSSSVHAITNLNRLPDEDVMEQLQSGVVEAFDVIVHRYKDRLHNFLFRYTNNHEDCEDLVQETFLRVYRSRHSYERIAKLSTWMYTIALNLAKSMYKKKQRMTTMSIHADSSDPDDVSTLLDRRIGSQGTHLGLGALASISVIVDSDGSVDLNKVPGSGTNSNGSRTCAYFQVYRARYSQTAIERPFRQDLPPRDHTAHRYNGEDQQEGNVSNVSSNSVHLATSATEG